MCECMRVCEHVLVYNNLSVVLFVCSQGDWQARRSVRHGKQEYLVLQNSLKNEVEVRSL